MSPNEDLFIFILRYSTKICFCNVMLVSQTWIFYTLEMAKLMFDVRFRLLYSFFNSPPPSPLNIVMYVYLI